MDKQAKIHISTLQSSDRDMVIELLMDDQVMKYLGPRRALDSAEANSWFDNALAHPSRFPFRSAQTGEIIGFCGIKSIDGELDFGYYLHRKFWGQGLGKRMCIIALEKLSDTYDLSSFKVFIADGNHASKRLAHSLGWRAIMKVQENHESGYRYHIPNAQ